MEGILKVICFFIALFVIANGVYVFFMPPTGDEPQGLAIIAIGIFIPILILFMARMEGRNERGKKICPLLSVFSRGIQECPYVRGIVHENGKS